MASKLDYQTFHNIVNGKPTPAKGTRKAINPVTGKELFDFPDSKQEDVDAAVSAAHKTFPAWAAKSMEERGKLIGDFGNALESRKQEFIDLLVLENGKPNVIADDELNRTIGHYKVTSKLRLEEEVIIDNNEKKATVRYVPLGVAGALVPWNYPVLLAAGKIGPALLAGNCLIVKPAPETPYTDIKMVELAQQFFPPGVLQILTGGPDLGPLFTSHPDIDKISFTGSIATGKAVMASCAKTLKRCTLELGGNDAAIVCEDVDFESAIPLIAQLSFLHAGQICMDVKRIYVHASIYDKFLSALTEYASNFQLGSGADEGAFVGPLQTSTQYDKVQSYLSEIKSSGLKTVLGTAKPKNGGYFVPPMYVDNPPDDARIMAEEPFGPVVPLVKWDGSDEDVVARANQGKYGLGASVWSSDIKRAEKMARGLQAGSVWVNMHFELAPDVPFGGHKWSGMGMEWGVVGLKAWCNVQSVWTPKAK